jgi:hypothetical protein
MTRWLAKRKEAQRGAKEASTVIHERQGVGIDGRSGSVKVKVEPAPTCPETCPSASQGDWTPWCMSRTSDSVYPAKRPWSALFLVAAHAVISASALRERRETVPGGLVRYDSLTDPAERYPRGDRCALG